jgi:WD40 repeat protein
MERKMRRIALLLILLFISCVYAQSGQRPAITVDNVSLLQVTSTIEIGSAVRAITWSADGKLLAIESTSAEVYIYSLETETLTPFEYEGLNTFIRDDTYIQIEDARTIFAIINGEVLTAIPSHAQAISSDGRMYATLEYTESEDAIISETIHIYDSTTHNLIQSVSIDMDERGCVYVCLPTLYFNPSNDKLVFITYVPDVESAIVDIATGLKTPLNRQDIFSLSGIVFHPDNQIFAATSGSPGYINDAIQLYNFDRGEIVASIDVYASSQPAFSPDGDLIAIGAFDEMAPNPDESTGYLYFFEVSQIIEDGSGDVDSVLYGHWRNSLIADIEFSVQGNFVAVGDDSGVVSIWGIPIEP